MADERQRGYQKKYDKKTKTFPVFINYDKRDDISDTTKYEDHFTGYNLNKIKLYHF